MRDGCDIHPGRPVAKGETANRCNLVVHPLHGAVSNPDTDAGQYTVEVNPGHPSELLEGLRPAGAGAAEPLARKDTAKKTHERVNDILLGPLERPVLQLLCRHMPAWINPDILTAMGVGGGLIIAFGYWLSNFDKNFLWLVDFGFVVNWLGDSLDGTLARYRKIERFKYGYFIDHTVDTFTQTMVCIGLGLSPFVDFNYAMLALVSYLQLGILTYVRTAVTGVFKVSYGKIGPTEVRVIVVGVNAVFYFASNPMIHLLVINISLFDLIILSIAVAFFIHYIVVTLQQAAALSKQDGSRKKCA